LHEGTQEIGKATADGGEKEQARRGICVGANKSANETAGLFSSMKFSVF